jgi:GH18 family chitinase
MLLLSACLALACLGTVQAKHVGCYYGTWAYSKFGLGTFYPEDLPVELCDVVYYGFGNILNNTFEMCSYDPWFDLGDPEFSDPTIRCLYSGGWMMGRSGPLAA